MQITPHHAVHKHLRLISLGMLSLTSWCRRHTKSDQLPESRAHGAAPRFCSSHPEPVQQEPISKQTILHKAAARPAMRPGRKITTPQLHPRPWRISTSPLGEAKAAVCSCVYILCQAVRTWLENRISLHLCILKPKYFAEFMLPRGNTEKCFVLL